MGDAKTAAHDLFTINFPQIATGTTYMFSVYMLFGIQGYAVGIRAFSRFDIVA